MSHETVDKEVQVAIVLNVFVCSIAANLDLQMKLDLDLVHQRVKSFLWKKGGWAACAWLSCSFISLPGTQRWNCTPGLQMPWGSCLACSITCQVRFHHSDTQCMKDVQRLTAGYFVWLSQMPAPKITPKGRQDMALWGIAQSLAGGSWWERRPSEHARAHCHLGNKMKGERQNHSGHLRQLRLSHHQCWACSEDHGRPAPRLR